MVCALAFGIKIGRINIPTHNTGKIFYYTFCVKTIMYILQKMAFSCAAVSQYFPGCRKYVQYSDRLPHPPPISTSSIAKPPTPHRSLRLAMPEEHQFFSINSCHQNVTTSKNFQDKCQKTPWFSAQESTFPNSFARNSLLKTFTFFWYFLSSYY